MLASSELNDAEWVPPSICKVKSVKYMFKRLKIPKKYFYLFSLTKTSNDRRRELDVRVAHRNLALDVRKSRVWETHGSPHVSVGALSAAM